MDKIKNDKNASPEPIGSIAFTFIDGKNNKVLAAASTLEVDVKKKLKNTSNKEAAVEIGKRIAEKAVKAGIKSVAFDRSGFKYHGRIKALADAARDNGLTF